MKYRVQIEMTNGQVMEQEVSKEFWDGFLYNALENDDNVEHYVVEKLGDKSDVYEAIETLIESKAIRFDLAKKVAFDAYYYDRIDGEEYEVLVAVAESICRRG